MELAYKIRQYVIMPILMIVLAITPAASSTDSAKLISTDTFVMDEAMVMGQGITTDGEYYYTSGSLVGIGFTALAKYTVDGMDYVDSHINPLPQKCEDRGNDHIGGISYYNGKIYTSVEGGEPEQSCIVVYNAENLKHTGEIYDLPTADFNDGVPWCAVDSDTGYLYASKWKDTKTIYVYDVNNGMAPVKTLTLSATIKRIQGGEFLDGTLYLSQDTHGTGKLRSILSVDTESGEVKTVAERDIGSEKFEAEGMTFTKDENGTVMHVLDYNKNIGIFVHHYAVDF